MTAAPPIGDPTRGRSGRESNAAGELVRLSLPVVIRLIGIILLSLFPLSCRAAAGPPLTMQTVEVTLDPPSHRLVGATTVMLPPGHSPRLRFSFTPRGEVISVESGGKPLPFTQNGAELSVTLPGGGEGAGMSVMIRFAATFDDPVPERPVSTEDPTHGVSGTIGPRGVFLSPGAGWHPAPLLPLERRRITVRVPPGMEAVTSGRRLSHRQGPEGGESVWEEEHPGEPLSLSAGPYVVTERSLDGLPLFAYFFPGEQDLAPRYLDAVERHLTLYRTLLGPFPFEKFAVVENFFPTGYGFPSHTLIGGSVIRLPFIPDTSLPHEIVHSWWGNGVRVGGGGNWSEGLATLLADHLMEERKSRKAGALYRFRTLADYASLVPDPPPLSLSRFTGRSDTVSRAVGYGKSMMIFYMLKMRLGDERFFGLLRELFFARRYGEASWDDFITAWSRAAGEDLDPVVRPLLEGVDDPRLALEGVKVGRGGRGWIVEGVLTRIGPPLPVKVPLRLEWEGGHRDHPLEAKGGKTRFSLETEEMPKRLLLDPEFTIFRRLSPEEIPRTVNSLKGSSGVTLLEDRSCSFSEGELRLFLRSLGQERGAALLPLPADPRSLPGGDLIVCGDLSVPEVSALVSLPDGVTAGRGWVLAGGRRFDGSGHLLFAVGSRGDRRSGTAAVIHADPGAGEEPLRKIQHYGRYGVLVFRGGENLLKEVVRPSSPTSSVDLETSTKDRRNR